MQPVVPDSTAKQNQALFAGNRLRQLAPFLLVLAAAAAATASCLQALNYPLVSDDITYITQNTKLASLELSGLWRLFIEPYSPHFEFLPLRELSYWLDMTLLGASPAALRMHNILLYLLSLPFVYGATLGLWRYFRPADPSAPWAAAAVTALFAIHPALVESVVWISGRKYVLPNFFSALALWLAIKARRENGLSPGYALAALAAFAAVMLSKSSYVAVAPLVALLWLLFWLDAPRPQRSRLVLLWPAAVLALGALLLKAFISKNQGFDSAPFYSGIEAVTRTLAALGGLARLSLTPEGRHFLYPLFEDPLLPFLAALGVVTLLAAAWGVIVLLRRRSAAGFALVAFLLLCLPYLQLMPAKPPSLLSDRYIALAIWPAMFFIVALIWRLRHLRAIVLLAIALPFLFQTAARPRDWQSFDTLIEADLRAYPGYFMPAVYKILDTQIPENQYRDAAIIANRISTPEMKEIMLKLIDTINVVATPSSDPREAMAMLENLGVALEQPPAQSRWNTPMLLAWNKNMDVLTLAWNSLSGRFPGDAVAHYNTGLWMLNTRKMDGAVAHLLAATRSRYLPEHMRGAAFRNLGLAMMRTGRINEAEAPLRAALEHIPPDNQAHCLLAEVYGRTGRLEEKAHAESNCRNVVSGSKLLN